jgi:hypothetical protein
LGKLNWHPVPVGNVPGNKSGNDIYRRRWYEMRKIGDGPDVNASV